MVLRIVLFAMMALGLGGFGIIAWVSTRPTAAVAVPTAPVAESAPVQAAAPEPPRPPAKVTVLVAARPVRAGSLLKPEEITAHEFLKNGAGGVVAGHHVVAVPAHAAADVQQQ